ncbi:hypothetical protein JHK87_027508 [Glycine soja]|nr:hypothetical protein JHK87_027508 [Glycine soja]
MVSTHNTIRTTNHSPWQTTLVVGPDPLKASSNCNGGQSRFTQGPNDGGRYASHKAMVSGRAEVLADLINLPCRIAKGCKYCRKDVGASCIVQFGSDRAGATCQPDSSLNSASSMLVPSPLCHPKFKPVETAEYTKTLAQLYFFDSEALHLVFDSTSVAWKGRAELRLKQSCIQGGYCWFGLGTNIIVGC